MSAVEVEQGKKPLKMKEKHQKWIESITLLVGVCIWYLFMLASMYNWADKMKEFRTYLT